MWIKNPPFFSVSCFAALLTRSGRSSLFRALVRLRLMNPFARGTISTNGSATEPHRRLPAPHRRSPRETYAGARPSSTRDTIPRPHRRRRGPHRSRRRACRHAPRAALATTNDSAPSRWSWVSNTAACAAASSSPNRLLERALESLADSVVLTFRAPPSAPSRSLDELRGAVELVGGVARGQAPPDLPWLVDDFSPNQLLRGVLNHGGR